MTITTNNAAARGEQEFSRRPATSRLETALTLGAGAAVSLYGILRRDWFGAAFASGGGYLLYCGVADLRRPYQGRARVAMTIAKEPQEVYEFVRRPENWDRCMRGVKLERDGESSVAVRFGLDGRWAWKSRAELTDEKPADYIAWASDEQIVEHRGVVRFKKAPGGRGTEISVTLEYKAPAGPIARWLASMAGFAPDQLIRETLRRIKQLMETGEIATTEGQPVGARGMKGAAKRVLFREMPAIDMEPQRLAGD